MSTPVVVSRIQNRRGLQSQFDALYPPGYNGTGGVDILVWPNILLPGELALCTDTRKIFLGNLNGEYVQLAEMVSAGEFLTPIEWILPPSAIWTPVTRVIPGPVTISLEYTQTPFLNLLYSITDNTSPNWNLLGTNFSKNGELAITAVSTSVSLSDTGTAVNLTPSFDISFKAQFDGSNIQVLYMHDFPGSLTLNTNSITWLPFI